MAWLRNERCPRSGLNSYGLNSYGLNSYGLNIVMAWLEKKDVRAQAADRHTVVRSDHRTDLREDI